MAWTQVLVAAAALLIVAAGFAIMLRRPRLAARLFIVAIVLSGGVLMARPNLGASANISAQSTFVLAIAMLAGASATAWRPRMALAILVLAGIAFFIGPAIPLWLWILASLPLSIFVAIWLLQCLLHPFYGDDASAHVAGVYLVRTFDAAGRGLLFLAAAPFRLLRRSKPR